MKIEIHLSDDKRTLSIAVDGGEPAIMDNFILLAEDIHDTRERRTNATEETIRRIM